MFKTLKDKFNRLGQKLGLHRWGDKRLNRLSDRQLRNVSRASTALGALAVGHAGIWVAIALAGAVALGLHAAGLAIPAFVGGATIALGALLAAKSAGAKMLFTVLDRKCKSILEKRGLSKPAPAPAPTAGADGKVAATAPLAGSFAPAASNTPPAPPAAPAPEIKPPEPAPPKP